MHPIMSTAYHSWKRDRFAQNHRAICPFHTAICYAFALFCLTSVSLGQGTAAIEADTPAESQTEETNSIATVDPPEASDLLLGESNEIGNETRENWGYFAPIELPPVETIEPGDASPLVQLKVGPDVFTHANFELSDLRIFDSNGSAIPYSLRVLAPKSVRDVMPTTEFNRLELEGEYELTLETSGDEGEHNEVQIETTGQRFRRSVTVDGSADGETWSTLTRGHLLRFENATQKVDVKSLEYSPSRFRFVRVRVKPDPDIEVDGSGSDKFELTEIRLLRTKELPGERSEWDVVIGQREPTRVMNAAGSSWIIDLPGENVPCDRLEVEVENGDFNRNVAIQAEYLSDILGQPAFVSLYLEDEGNWQRKPGEPKRPMVVNFSEVRTRRLRLFVADARNVPLTIRSARVSAPARQIVFQRPTSPDVSLKLFAGNPLAEPPGYDFARNLPELLEPKPATASLEPIVRNPDFTPPPLPFTERFPWLIYVVLGGVSAILLWLIANLAKTSLKRHDSQSLEAPSV